MCAKTTRSLAFCATLFALSSFSPAVHGAQPLITDDTGTQGTGGNQLELGMTEDKAIQGTKTTKTQTIPLTYTHGMTDTLDLFVSVSSMRIRSTDTTANAQGSGNPGFGGKWRFYENEDSKTSFGFKQEVRLPVNVAKERLALGVGKTSYSSTFIVPRSCLLVRCTPISGLPGIAMRM